MNEVQPRHQSMSAAPPPPSMGPQQQQQHQPVSSGGSAAIMARLDAYLPALNTGMMDVRVQDAILKYPIVRSLIIPECDLEARRRCISLITKVLNAATPVLPLILQEQTHLNNNANSNRPPIPVLSLDAQTKVMTIISTMAERDRLIRFWMNHHVNNKGAKPQNDEELPPTIALYTKIKQSKEILSDLADRIQGAICIVFWECWDEIYPTLADIVGGDEMARADTGRIFRPSGEAALYINRLKVEKKHRMERERRESLAATSASSASPPISAPMFEGNTGSSFWDSLNNNNTNNSNPANSASTGDSPASLMTDTSNSSSSWTFHSMAPPAHHGSQGSELELIDSGELDYLMEEVYKNPQQSNGSNNDTGGPMDSFTNFDSPSSQFHLQSQLDMTSPKAGTPKNTHPAPHQHLDLRKRIKMMEDGQLQEEHHDPMASIIW
ncbi:hypothetical protein TRICI_002411 [Trichomonascus ciferrii]|uniref:Uncharacterized protein n=1 Tax=Trichomonascus ciferrii TaxID=44093 RepID=A0A642V6T0_9ASCO|nr:hypothetical protein TRICI_002411 [Trichomonascus ciferrii]